MKPTHVCERCGKPLHNGGSHGWFHIEQRMSLQSVGVVEKAENWVYECRPVEWPVASQYPGDYTAVQEYIKAKRQARLDARHVPVPLGTQEADDLELLDVLAGPSVQTPKTTHEVVLECDDCGARAKRSVWLASAPKTYHMLCSKCGGLLFEVERR